MAIFLRTSRLTVWTALQRVRAYFSAGVCIAGLASLTSATSLEIDPKSFNDGKVDCKSGPCYTALAPSSNAPMTQTDTTSYAVFMNSARTLPGTGYFVYEFCVQLKNTSQRSGGQGCAIRVQGLTSGTFMDQTAEITFHVGNAGHLEDGTMRIPPSNSRYSKAILDYQLLTLSGVSLSGQSPIEIGISNTLVDLPIGIYKDTVVHSERPDLWQDAPQAALQPQRSGPVIFQPEQEAVFKLGPKGKAVERFVP